MLAEFCKMFMNILRNLPNSGIRRILCRQPEVCRNFTKFIGIWRQLPEFDEYYGLQPTSDGRRRTVDAGRSTPDGRPLFASSISSQRSRSPQWGAKWIVNWIFPKTSRGSFSAVSTPIFASKYSLESSRRDLHNALLCTVLVSQFFRQKSPFFFAIELMNIH